MANLLIVAEKPSVARSIADAIGVKEEKKHEGYIEGFSDFFGYTVWVTWCLGHLVQMSYPESYDPKYAKWSLEDLPLIPEEFKYEVIPETRKQFEIVAKLMNSVGESDLDKKEISTLSEDKKFLVPTLLICLATDSGREGELIGRLVYHQAGCSKPMKRLWISSMEDQAIEEGFRNLRPSSEYDSLYEAALCRERADWIVGINATRLFSCLYRQKLNVGRVMTPTLAMVVLRDAEIMAFKPEAFYTVQLHLPGFVAVSRKWKDKSEAEAVMNACNTSGVAQVVKLERKEKKENAPALYDLTSLQRDANRVYGFTAQQTLDYAQALYEKKLITYPRTDSRYLTDDMADALPEWIQGIAEKFSVTDIHPGQKEIQQVINSKKVTDHHAIIPTKSCKNASFDELPSGELQICKMIAGRFLTAVSQPHLYAETICEMKCGNEVFTAKGKEVLLAGWKEIEAIFRPSKKESDPNKEPVVLPAMKEGDTVSIHKVEIKEGKTTAPKKYTEDSLLAAMESAGAAEMSDEVERKGLGTPATRAGIIEKLVRTGLITRQGDKKTKYLTATDKGLSLITVMPEQIQSPSMTADWEMKLLRV
ncbi:MAG: DNA topoisomerase 3, partial [Lachnospiraceae bacterium]|nr:DNA topoisomerase 3 [Lachnospiraceae bacterium]